MRLYRQISSSGEGRVTVLMSAPAPAEAAPEPTALVGLAHLGEDLGADGVDDVLGLVEDGGGRAVVEPGRLLGRAGRHQGAVRPVHVGQAALVALADVGAAPGRVGSEVEVALPHGLAIGVGAALEVLALLPHGHSA